MSKALQLIFAELERAEKLHPIWPWDIVHQAGVVAAQSGALMQAAMTCSASEDKNKTACIREAIHTASAAIRFLQNQDLSDYGR